VSVGDAAGLTVLIYACRAATAAHVKLVLSAPSPLVLKLLEPTRLNEQCDVELEPGHARPDTGDRCLDLSNSRGHPHTAPGPLLGSANPLRTSTATAPGAST
jgi:hypothetical protein